MLASDSYADLLRRSQEKQRWAAAFYRAVRETARRAVALLAAGNTTALQAAEALADRLAAERQLQYVIYRNGARVPTQAEATTPGRGGLRRSRSMGRVNGVRRVKAAGEAEHDPAADLRKGLQLVEGCGRHFFLTRLSGLIRSDVVRVLCEWGAL